MKLLSLMLALLAAGPATMTPASADPLAFPTYPRATVVEEHADAEAEEYEFVLSPVEKIRRELKIERSLHVTAKRRSVTYEMPRGTSLEAVIEHFESVLPAGQIRFRCLGRDCGRSNQWANQVFGIPVLYGPDAYQFYLAGEDAGALVSVYVIKRGNRRVYAHLQVLQPEREVAVAVDQRLLKALTGNGHAIVRGVTPTRSGEITAEDRAHLSKIGGALNEMQADAIYVVCHLYAPGDVERLIQRSGACAEAAAEALAAESSASFKPFAAGPMMPRQNESHSRIELVVPHRQNRD